MPDISNRVGPATLRLVKNYVDRVREAGGPAEGDGGYGRPDSGTDIEDGPELAICLHGGKECFTAEAIDGSRKAGAAVYRLARRHFDDTAHTIRITVTRTTTRELY